MCVHLEPRLPGQGCTHACLPFIVFVCLVTYHPLVILLTVNVRFARSNALGFDSNFKHNLWLPLSPGAILACDFPCILCPFISPCHPQDSCGTPCVCTLAICSLKRPGFWRECNQYIANKVDLFNTHFYK